jgi:hypothetical protein
LLKTGVFKKQNVRGLYVKLRGNKKQADYLFNEVNGLNAAALEMEGG